MRPIYPLFGPTLRDEPQVSAAQELARFLAHFPKEWNALKVALDQYQIPWAKGMVLILDGIPWWDGPSRGSVWYEVPTDSPPTLEEVLESYREVLPACRDGLKALDTDYTDHLRWAGQRNLYHSLCAAARHVQVHHHAEMIGF